MRLHACDPIATVLCFMVLLEGVVRGTTADALDDSSPGSIREANLKPRNNRKCGPKVCAYDKGTALRCIVSQRNHQN